MGGILGPRPDPASAPAASLRPASQPPPTSERQPAPATIERCRGDHPPTWRPSWRSRATPRARRGDPDGPATDASCGCATRAHARRGHRGRPRLGGAHPRARSARLPGRRILAEESGGHRDRGGGRPEPTAGAGGRGSSTPSTGPSTTPTACPSSASASGWPSTAGRPWAWSTTPRAMSCTRPPSGGGTRLAGCPCACPSRDASRTASITLAPFRGRGCPRATSDPACDAREPRAGQLRAGPGLCGQRALRCLHPGAAASPTGTSGGGADRPEAGATVTDLAAARGSTSRGGANRAVLAAAAPHHAALLRLLAGGALPRRLRRERQAGDHRQPASPSGAAIPSSGCAPSSRPPAGRCWSWSAAGGAGALVEQGPRGGRAPCGAAGGDGTLRDVASARGRHGGSRLGILPGGTTNVFARELGIPSRARGRRRRCS